MSAEGHNPSDSALSSFVVRPSPLAGEVRAVGDLYTSERDAMYSLLTEYFADTSHTVFARDLAEKEWAILLHDADGVLRGFSTLMRMRATLDGRPLQAFFSGDTIVHHAHRAETALPRLWAQHVFRLAAEVQDAEVYWFLICSGYKTYRFLPLFFREFYPTFERPTPAAMQRALDTFAQRKFPVEYDLARGIVRLAEAAPLRPSVADITKQRLRDPHVAFFVQANPGHGDGDELACLAPLRVENLTTAGRRMLGMN